MFVPQTEKGKLQIAAVSISILIVYRYFAKYNKYTLVLMYNIVM